MEHLIPVFSVLFGVILLGERLELYHGLGAALIAAGIYLTAVLRSKGAAGH
jgi:drug/metabolite transporter (DMT)-like permease